MSTPEGKGQPSLIEKVGETISKAKEWIVGSSEEQTKEEKGQQVHPVPTGHQVGHEQSQTKQTKEVKEEKGVNLEGSEEFEKEIIEENLSVEEKKIRESISFDAKRIAEIQREKEEKEKELKGLEERVIQRKLKKNIIEKDREDKEKRRKHFEGNIKTWSSRRRKG